MGRGNAPVPLGYSSLPGCDASSAQGGNFRGDSVRRVEAPRGGWALVVEEGRHQGRVRTLLDGPGGDGVPEPPGVEGGDPPRLAGPLGGPKPYFSKLNEPRANSRFPASITS